jgi:hypothetical protein
MNGYLMQEQDWVPGQDLFIESFSPESRYGVVFEDDGEAAYFYAVERDSEGAGVRVLDALHIHESEDRTERKDSGDPSLWPKTNPGPGGDGSVGNDPSGDEPGAGEPGGGNAGARPSPLKIVWSRDWMKCALVIDGYCHALFDFEAHGGYNINEFPPPNDFWSKGERKLSDELIQRLF